MIRDSGLLFLGHPVYTGGLKGQVCRFMVLRVGRHLVLTDFRS